MGKLFVMAYTFCRDVQLIWHRRWMHFPRLLALDKCFNVCNSEKGSHGTADCGFLSFILKTVCKGFKVSSRFEH